MIIAYDDIEYSHIISDLINEISIDVEFQVDIWTDGSELPQSINTKEQDVEEKNTTPTNVERFYLYSLDFSK